MNKMTKLAAFALTASMMAGTTAAAEVYTGAGNGYGGEMKVDVTIENGIITDLKLGENHETNVVIDRAFPVISERIIKANSPVVDSVSAATFSSYAVKTAVADAMTQAGIETEKITMATAGEEKPETQREAETCDIVIVGGGPAGLAAAVSAKQTNPELHVVIVEKLDILSGNGKFDMNFFDMIGTEAQKAVGNKWGADNAVELFMEDQADSGETPERLQVWANEEAGLDAWLREMGAELDFSYGSGTSHMAKDNQYAGEVVQAGLENAAENLNVDIRTGTKGLDLVMEDGVCKGVVVKNNDNQTYTIHAKSTIVATGGFCSNKELLAEYAPGHEVLNTSNQMGTTGDFVKIFEKYGFQMKNMDHMSVFSNIIVPRRDLTGGADMNLLVNSEGKLLPNKSGMERATMIKDQPNGAAYYITDKTGYESFYRIRKHVALGYYTQGETLAELAESLKIDADGLEAAVAQHNADAEAGAENEMIGAVPKRALDAEGPYYGVRVEAANHMTKGGVVANENSQVIAGDGTVVPGLYAAGEVVAQPGCYSTCVVFGKVAGAHAASAK